MPKRPSGSGYSLSIDEDFDESRNYRVKLFEIEEGPARYPGAKPGQMAIIWKLNIYRDDGTVFENPNTGEVFDVWAFSSDSTFKTSQGRVFIDAFMGHETTDEEVDELIDNGFTESLVGKTALGSFKIETTADGNERLKPILLRPDRPPGRRAPASQGELDSEPPRPRRRIDD